MSDGRLAKENKVLKEDLELANAAVNDLAEALRLTVEYVGLEILPPIEGWSWYDALNEHRPQLSAPFLARYLEASYE